MTGLKKALLGASAAALLLGALTPPAAAGGFFTNGVPPAGGTQYPTTVPLTGNETIPADTNLPNGQNPQSESITVGQLGALAADPFPRNYLDNGAFAVNQQGTGAITGGTTSITALQFAADRWFIDTNVTSGAGQGQIATTAALLPAGFQQVVKLWRNSGALTQPVCTLHEIETTRAIQLAGKYVVLSSYVAALAGLTAAGNAVSAYVITGTGTDQGLGTLTASPAITPAWTGIAGGTTAAAIWTTTTTPTRYYTPPVLIPATATEVGVEICFTPVGSSSGATDGIALTGVQLESVAYTATTVAAPPPSAFEFHQLSYDLAQAQRFFYQVNEPASGAALSWIGEATGASTNAITVPLPVPMRGTTPVVVIPATGTFKVNIAGTATTWVTPTAGVCSTSACQITGGNTNTAGQVELVTGGGGSGVVYVKNDVIM